MTITFAAFRDYLYLTNKDLHRFTRISRFNNTKNIFTNHPITRTHPTQSEVVCR